MPVDPATLAAFVLATAILLVIPGPTVVMVVGQALAHGRVVALASVLGVGLGDLIAASLSLAGVGALLAASATAFVILKWLGAAYLVFMGVKLWRNPPDFTETAGDPRQGTPRKVFRDAFLVTLFNPKGIVFFAAFVPQFIAHDRPFLPQAAIFVASFVALGIVNAALYARLAAGARRLARRPSILRAMGRTGGLCLIGAGLASALVRRPA
ncbi:LysE family translocator [Aurantimonas sp. VKM B-3413]|uniref:LysE family translocator n=1 Tax=Aurantimonas sp. VKM B-3413 TaxID=2779401 RepID=UPI001E6567B7|nr:LysE family translocator [Aurantimonas sp. VKM B-3413]MCB8838425.1 LysE family translocator [Aurantimonas sp. VKM B-3413]